MIRRLLKKYLIISLIISILTNNFLSINKSYAALEDTGGENQSGKTLVTVENAGDVLATWAEKFCEANGTAAAGASKCWYPDVKLYGWDYIYAHRGATYRGDELDPYVFDCTFWVLLALDQALNLHYDTCDSGSRTVIDGDGVGSAPELTEFSDINNAKRGDILMTHGHVAIYLGNGKVVDAWQNSRWLL